MLDTMDDEYEFLLKDDRCQITPTDSDATEDKGLSLFAAVLYIVGIFGVFPVLALPRTLIDCGWMGFLVLAVVWLVQLYTAIILGRCWLIAERIDPSIVSQSRYPYAALAERTLGRRARRIVGVVLNLALFGALLTFLIVASHNLQVFVEKITGYDSGIAFCYWLLLLSSFLCPCMWLGSPKEMTFVTGLSVLSVVAVSILTCTAMWRDNRISTPPHKILPSWQAVVAVYGTLCFQFDVHPVILTVQMDMKEKQKLGVAAFCGFVLSGALFLTTCIGAYMVYGDTTHANLLGSLPDEVTVHLDIVLVTIQLCLCIVLDSNTIFQDVEDCLGIPQDFNWRRCAVRTTLLLIAVVIAEAVPDFSVVMGLVGGLLSGPLIMVLPPTFYFILKSQDMLDPPSVSEKLLNIVIIALGLLGTVCATYSGSIDFFNSWKNTNSCLLNFTIITNRTGS